MLVKAKMKQRMQMMNQIVSLIQKEINSAGVSLVYIVDQPMQGASLKKRKRSTNSMHILWVASNSTIL